MTEPEYGRGDASLRAAGGEAGVARLVDAFYEEMDTRPDAARIRAMHPADLTESIDKLARFLTGWLGGPKRYSEKYGSIRLPHAHKHLPVTSEDRDAWLTCMEAALQRQPFREDFREYLLVQLAIPADRIVRICQG